MDSEHIFQASAVERRAFADLLESLDAGQLSTQSLCGRWDVKTVGAHLASALAPSTKLLLTALLRSGFNAHRANDRVARQAARLPVAHIVKELRTRAESRFTPPVVGPPGPLTDVLVHTGDVRIPLGLDHDPAAPHVLAALTFVTQGRPIGIVRRGRLVGLQLVAEDLGWSWGTGPRLAGRGIDILMAVCGRSATVARLTGPGVETLTARLGPSP